MADSKYWRIAALVACAGCCALPLLAWFGVGAAAGSLAFISDTIICVLLVLLLGLFLLFRRKPDCCPEPGKGCTANQCSRAREEGIDN